MINRFVKTPNNSMNQNLGCTQAQYEFNLNETTSTGEESEKEIISSFISMTTTTPIKEGSLDTPLADSATVWHTRATTSTAQDNKHHNIQDLGMTDTAMLKCTEWKLHLDQQ